MAKGGVALCEISTFVINFLLKYKVYSVYLPLKSNSLEGKHKRIKS